MALASDLFGSQPDAVVCVMGGAQSIEEHLAVVDADLYVSCNGHGSRFAEPDYFVAMDPMHGCGDGMHDYLRACGSAPIVSRQPWADYLLAWWPGHPRTSVLTGMVAAWFAGELGARCVLLAGMDGYGGMDEAFRSARQAAAHIRCPVRVVGGGPLTSIWPEA